MKATIRDLEVLNAVQPLEVATYLRANGWHQFDEVSNRASFWTLNESKVEDYEILLPLKRDVRDFPARIGEILQTLEVVEQRSQLEILNELATTAADVVSLRVSSVEASDGSVLIDDGVSLFQHARDMMMSAACAAVEPKAQFQTRKPKEAIEYLGKLRVGQTERGSYVVNIISRVAPTLESDTLFSTEPYEQSQPFERVVVQTLAKALMATRSAAEHSAISGNLEPFNNAIREGVSANLCESIVGMSNSGGEAGLSVGLRWARTRPLHGQFPREVSFSPDTMPFIEEAGRLFRDTPPREGFEVEGYVVKLAREEGEEQGTITIASLVEGKSRKINVDLSGEDYHLAVQAHDEVIPVVCYGNLVKQGGSFLLQNPHGFTLNI